MELGAECPSIHRTNLSKTPAPPPNHPHPRNHLLSPKGGPEYLGRLSPSSILGNASSGTSFLGNAHGGPPSPLGSYTRAIVPWARWSERTRCEQGSRAPRSTGREQEEPEVQREGGKGRERIEVNVLSIYTPLSSTFRFLIELLCLGFAC